MKQKFSKRIIACVMAFVICVAVAGFSFALPASGIQTRNITVDTSKVLQSNYQGVGDNLWTGPYYYGMNDAYQKVNDVRTNAVQPAWMRMMFFPQWLVYLDETPEVQQQRWEAGDYNWDSLEFKNFMIKIKGLLSAGCIIQLNMGGRVHVLSGMSSWFSIKDSALSEGGSRGAPHDLVAFAKATTAVIQKILEASNTYGIEGVNKDTCYLSFYNEVNGGNFEAFGDRRLYWCNMIKKVHYALKEAHIRSKVQICGTELAGYVDETYITSYLSYVVKNLVDESGNPIYDYLCTHEYPKQRNYDTMLDLSTKMIDFLKGLGLNDSDIKMRNTEGSAGMSPFGSGNDHIYNFEMNDISQVISNTNAAWDGYGSWFYYGEMIPDPINVGQTNINIVMWACPSLGFDQVGINFPGKALAMRYVPKHSVTYKTTVDSTDIIASSYKKGNDFTVVIDSDRSDVSRKLSIDVDGAVPNGTVVERHMFSYGEPDADGYEFSDQTAIFEETDANGNVSGGANAIVPPTDKRITVQNGKIVDDSIPDGHYSIVYTTMKEQAQIQLDKPEAIIRAGESITFNVEKLYGANENINDVTWEIVGKCPVDAIKNDGGYGWSTTNSGVLNTTSGKTATYTASGVETGDCIAIKVTPNADTSAYKVIVVAIGYKLTFKETDDTVISTMGIKIPESTTYNKYNSLYYLPVPEKDGYDFKGWYDNKDFVGDVYSIQNYDWNSDITLYAKWATKQ